MLSFYQTTLFKLKKFTCSFGFVAFFFFLLSTVCFSHNFVVCNRHPFGSLVKFKLWNLLFLRILSLSYDSAANRPCLFLFLQRSWPALALQSCSSHGCRGIQNLPMPWTFFHWRFWFWISTCSTLRSLCIIYLQNQL